ncbi:MAG: phosphoribosylamine--glycine ligase [SAR324 cluster bacterium]|nr:phosphoribosylamine--glycine ligase [SAR324 cluster bacterium]
MKILITGQGGREHALAWSFAKDPQVSKIYIAPGNGGTALEAKCVNIAYQNKEQLLKFAIDNKINFTFIGAEDLLADGVVDLFKEQGLKIFGPTKKQAQLESSKYFAKKFMQKFNIKTPAYIRFSDSQAAINHIKSLADDDFPLIIKADGLAAGKGVIIAKNKLEASDAIKRIMVDKSFGIAGNLILIEEYLTGVEASILALCDGDTILPLPSAKDHKRIGEGDSGENTGGMGVISPNPLLSEAQNQNFIKGVLQPTLDGIKQNNWDFVGVIFFGLMIVKDEVYLLEYNVRMGDPETQSVLMLLEEPFTKVVESAFHKNLKNFTLRIKKGYSCCVVSSSGGYPGNYKSGELIEWENKSDNFTQETNNQKVFVAGASLKKDNHLYTSGGRVLGSVAVAPELEMAREKSLSQLAKINFKKQYFRRDIGRLPNS